VNFGIVGKTLIIAGLLVVGLGVLLIVIGKIPLIGKLPGDIAVHKKNFSFYFPLATSILLSLILSAILFIINYFRK